MSIAPAIAAKLACGSFVLTTRPHRPDVAADAKLALDAFAEHMAAHPGLVVCELFSVDAARHRDTRLVGSVSEAEAAQLHQAHVEAGAKACKVMADGTRTTYSPKLTGTRGRWRVDLP